MAERDTVPDVDVDLQRARLLRWLERRDAGEVKLHETHVSILAFTAERVWKCKKAVRFPFIDLATSAARLANCEREVALNRRLAPDVYLGVVPLEDERGAVVDHVVEMRRLPDARRLAELVTHGGDAGADCLDKIVDLLVEFHAHARRGGDIDRSATPAALADLWARSLDELRPFAERVVDPETVEQVGRDADRYLAGRSPLLEDRIRAGKVCDGHGDLLADDVFCLDDGPRVLDCLEFDEQLRFGDVLADIAFLAMDLERLGRRDLARRLSERYRERAGDQWPASLEHHYVAYRAVVRAKVACLRVDAGDADAAPAARSQLALTARHLAEGRVRMVLIGGPPATGKTTLARALAERTGWPVFHSDDVRKQLAGLEPSASAAAPLGAGLYTAEWNDRTYAALLERAREQLRHGNSVILDASWSSEERRAQAAVVADQTASELTSFVCAVAPDVADARASARAEAGRDSSDASAAIAADLRARFVPWPRAVTLVTTDATDILVGHVLEQQGLAATPD